MSEDVTVKQEGEEINVSLADIGGIDMTDVEKFEGGFEPTPKGLFRFSCKDAGLDTINGKAVIYFECGIEEVYALVDDDKKPEDLEGKWTHRETIFIGDLAKSVGQAKAIMENAGFTGRGKLDEMLDAFVGHEFVAPIKQRRDRNDTDRVYSNFDVKKISPVKNEAA